MGARAEVIPRHRAFAGTDEAASFPLQNSGLIQEHRPKGRVPLPGRVWGLHPTPARAQPCARMPCTTGNSTSFFSGSSHASWALALSWPEGSSRSLRLCGTPPGRDDTQPLVPTPSL